MKDFYVDKTASGYSRSDIESLMEKATGIQPPKKTKLNDLYKLWGACERKKPALDSSTLYDVVASFTKNTGSLLGYRELTARIRESYPNHFISRDYVAMMSRLQNPEAAERRIPRGLKHPCVFTCPGPGYLIAIDGYDKLRCYGFDIHLSVDAATRLLYWVRLVNTNSDPRNIGRVYLQHLHETKTISRLMTTDLGTENGIIARLHYIYQPTDDDESDGASGVIFHADSARNERAELMNSRLFKWCTKKWIQLFKHLHHIALLIPLNPIDMECAQAIFRPLLTKDLQQFKTRHNAHTIRKQRNSQYSGKSPQFMFDAIDPSWPARLDRPIRDLDFDDAARVCDIPDWKRDPDVQGTINVHFQQVYDATITIPPDFESSMHAYVMLRAAWTRALDQFCVSDSD